MNQIKQEVENWQLKGKKRQNNHGGIKMLVRFQVDLVHLVLLKFTPELKGPVLYATSPKKASKIHQSVSRALLQDNLKRRL